MNSNMKTRIGIAVLALLVIGLLALVGAPAVRADDASVNAATASTHRPIAEFVAAQGTYCIDDGAGGCYIFEAPLPNFLGQSDPARDLAASVDYAGFAETYLVTHGGDSLGTKTSGYIVERSLSDGRANVHVVLRTKNALTWVEAGADFSGPLLFGNKVVDVLAGAPPALCLSIWDIRFINTAPGAPMPDMMQLIFAPESGQEIISIRASCTAKGEFHAAFGVPEGTRGNARINQILRVVDGNFTFPVERVLLRAKQ